MLTFAKVRSASRRTARPRLARIEFLEPRLVLYAASGYEWISPNVSFSFVPEGASVEGYSNTLFSELNAIAPAEVWQREFARALQTWANASNLNFHQVVDSGLASGTVGSGQGDARFGDIRLAAHALSGPLAYAYYPSGGSNTIVGDIFLATEFNFQVGANYDLYSVLLHEAGHTLGLRHTAGSVMNANYQGVLAGLTADDVAGIQSIYGARQQDAFDAIASNDLREAATVLTVGGDGTFSGAADLQSLDDVDYYALAVPQSSDGTFTVSIDAAGLSLLAPKASVYDAAGTLLGSADVGSAYGTTATINLTGVSAGEVLYVMADGATGDAFGMGAYRINVSMGIGDNGGGEPPSAPPGDRYEANDSLATATNLGRFNSKTVSDVTLHTASDVDVYRFTAQKIGTFQISTRFDAASSSHITVYDARGNLVGQSTTGVVTVSLATSEIALVQVSSPTGALDIYDLVFERVGGGGGGKGQKGGPLEPDGYYAEGGHDDHHAHSVGRHDFRDAAGHVDLGVLAAAVVRSASTFRAEVDVSERSAVSESLNSVALHHDAAFADAAAPQESRLSRVAISSKAYREWSVRSGAERA